MMRQRSAHAFLKKTDWLIITLWVHLFLPADKEAETASEQVAMG
jgi:hypothetical protein